jgi:DNA-binding NarL/FixJ family response regulator
MAKLKSITVSENFNPALSIKFVNPLELEQWQAKGYELMMARKPNFSVLLMLTERERAITKLLLHGNESQQIAGLLSMAERNVRYALQSIREKLQCRNNIDLVIKLKEDGLDSYLFQNG